MYKKIKTDNYVQITEEPCGNCVYFVPMEPLAR